MTRALRFRSRTAPCGALARGLRCCCGLVLGLVICASADAQTFHPTTQTTPEPVIWPAHDGVFEIRDFHFKDGETLDVLRLHYLTLGTPHHDAAGHTDNAILLLHGTGGNARSLLAPQFSGVLFGPGQPLDITKYFLILPDDIGHGQSSKPSDGLHMRFPAYDYDDMVASQHTMLLDGLQVDHLRLILGTSMGCMQAFVWGETFPGFADALAPFACLPVEIAGRNRMMRYIAIEAIKQDPAWNGGEYSEEPLLGLRIADEMVLIMGSAPLLLQKNFPTRLAAERRVEAYLEEHVPQTDANDLIYYFEASRDYNPAPRLAEITAPVLWINSADDFVNPPELHIAEQMVGRLPHGRFVLIPISDATRGHGTHTQAAVWKDYLIEFLDQTDPQRKRRRP
ncbi:MAG: alpha/beta fold hydrolase [Steroidobacteraceae bacterium]